ncbi:hypothetical protein BJX70DRAFT_383003 [Aspergillus crustosus]
MAISIADSSCSSPRSSLGFLLDPEKFELPRPKQSMWHRLGLRRWLGRDDRDYASRSPSSSDDSSPASNSRSKGTASPPRKSHDNLTRRLSRRVGVGLPRSTAFKRQHSECRDRLSPVNTEPRRAASADRRELSLQRTKSPQSVVDPRLSAPEINLNWRDEPDPDPDHLTKDDEPLEPNEEPPQDNDSRSEWDQYPEVTDTPEGYPADIFDMELERRWILNLSMHFRDRSEREKFFVTYAEAPNRWRRVTISCDYRDAEPDSLEQDLRELRYQRDKCARIYESIRESLPSIQFYDTVTNLKLETRDGRLHVHVTEDVNEIIPYPPISSIGHLPEARLVPERRLHFEAHLSGFVYNVRLGDRSFIKKEIPGPDTVDEFLYEINALHALQGTPNVIQVEGIVVDDRQEVVKGLLISFAEKGALVDLLYEHRGTISWERRERWARQIVHGLSEIHEGGYVQGDFTLSNIVVDGNDDAKIIDINRRGCPVGWEPPEIAAKIESNQRISMYIGVKTDLYQLGMTLWALAMEEDEPERQRRPFAFDEDMPVPDYYRRLVAICLSPFPRNRLSAKELLTLFPPEVGTFDQLPRVHPHIGVGLHNGALPLYDSRAAFLYPRGRQMGSFGHSNPQTPRQPTHDSFDSASSPTSNGAAFDREEHERQIEVYDMGIRPNGVHKRDSIIFDERSSVEHSVTMDGTHYDQQHAPLFYEEDDLDLNAGVSTRYQNASTNLTADSPADTKWFPDELTGVGTWKPTSRNSPVQYQQPELPSTTQAPVDIYPVDSVAETRPEEEFQTLPSLLQSALPINPATESLEQGTDGSSGNILPLTAALEHPQQINHQETYLSDSTLPINPAIKALGETLDDLMVPQPPPEVQPVLEHVQSNLQLASPYLSDSQLPINPATKPQEEPPLIEADQPDLHAKASFSNPRQIAQDHSHDLRDSHLLINPAIESLEPTVFLPKDAPSAVDSVQPTPSQATVQALNESAFLSNSQLPINPATIVEASSTKPATKPVPSTGPTAHPQQIIQKQNHDAFLSSSQLPINPATMSESINIEKKPVVNGGLTTNPQHTIQDQDQPTSLSESHLPTNPAAISEVFGTKLETKPALEGESTARTQQILQEQTHDTNLNNSHLPINPAVRSPEKEMLTTATNPITTLANYATPTPQQSSNDRNPCLSNSHLPINPSFTDKALQFV